MLILFLLYCSGFEQLVVKFIRSHLKSASGGFEMASIIMAMVNIIEF